MTLLLGHMYSRRRFFSFLKAAFPFDYILLCTELCFMRSHLSMFGLHGCAARVLFKRQALSCAFEVYSLLLLSQSQAMEYSVEVFDLTIIEFSEV